MYEESYIYNKNVAKYASRIGDLDQAEYCYRNAIDDASKLNNVKYEKGSILELTNDVLLVWGRYDEAFRNYQELSEYYSDIQDLGHQSRLLRNIGNIHSRRRDDNKALERYNEGLRVCYDTHPKV